MEAWAAMRFIALLLVACAAALLYALPADAELPQEDFTHAVVGEEMTAIWCQFCPSAAENLNKVYRPKSEFPDDPYYHDQFFFVALITDVNDKAQARYNDYRPAGSQSYPNVYFDGGDEEVTGGQSDTSDYENAIDNCGSRVDTDISMRMAMQHAGGDTIDVQVWVTWNEDAGIGDPTFNGYLRVYITEVVSRYNNYDGDPYHFGFMDYAFDQQVELDPHTELELTTTWSGSDYQDTDGNDFSDLSYDNLALMAAFFNDEDLSDDKYALQTAHAIPPALAIDTPDGDLSDTATITGTADAERSVLTSLEYRIDDGGWQGFTAADDWSFDWDTTTVANGDHDLMVRAIDENGTSMVRSLTVHVSNDNTPPDVEWALPYDGSTVSGNVTLEADAADDTGIDYVKYRVPGLGWEALPHVSGDTYRKTWNSREVVNDDYTLEVCAYDAAGNSDCDAITVTVSNEGDETYPALTLIAPTAGLYSGNIEIIANASDPDGLAHVKYRVDEGAWKTMSGDPWTASWNSFGADGSHSLVVRATDTTGLFSEETVAFITDSTPPLLIIDPPVGALTARATFGIGVSDPSGVASLQYRIDGGSWHTLNLLATEFEWDSTTVEDGTHTLEISTTDLLGNPRTVTRNLEVENTGLAMGSAPARSAAGTPITVRGYIGYEDPVAVWLMVAGQKVPMTGGGGLYTAEVTIAESGTHAYVIEVDTGHGSFHSREQMLVVGGASASDDDDVLPGPGAALAALGLLAVAVARRRR